MYVGASVDVKGLDVLAKVLVNSGKLADHKLILIKVNDD